jgi:hypothetical protein
MRKHSAADTAPAFQDDHIDLLPAQLKSSTEAARPAPMMMTLGFRGRAMRPIADEDNISPPVAIRPWRIKLLRDTMSVYDVGNGMMLTVVPSFRTVYSKSGFLPL